MNDIKRKTKSYKYSANLPNWKMSDVCNAKLASSWGYTAEILAQTRDQVSPFQKMLKKSYFS